MKTDKNVEDILQWIRKRNKEIEVEIKKIPPAECEGWSYDEETGTIHNEKGTFFSIGGLKGVFRGKEVEQPVIYQKEIGYLGFLCARIDGEIKFLIQSKIEPGNVNQVQLSPTIQATKSNFTQQHGGAKPAYLEYFLEADNEHIIVDQIQSEQSSRFLGKRNRNIIVFVDDAQSIPLTDNHRWVSLHELKQLMQYDNLVNMDTRTVLSCIPYFLMDEGFWTKKWASEAVKASVLSTPDRAKLVDIYRYINNIRMFSEDSVNEVKLSELDSWITDDEGIHCSTEYPFKAVFCDISIDGREVKHWYQPLFEATGIATFGILTREHNGKTEFLVQIKPEIGCYDFAELGPSVQREAYSTEEETDIDRLFNEKLNENRNVVFDTLLSEEGGRFYHEENRNVIISIDEEAIPEAYLCNGRYIWCDYATLNMLLMVNNCLNIQLRSLLAVWDMFGDRTEQEE